MDTKITFLRIPDAILSDTNFSPAEKLLYGRIISLSNSKGYCFAGNTKLAEIQGCTPNTISAQISNLVKHGLLKLKLQRQKDGKGTDRKIYLTYKPFLRNCMTEEGHQNASRYFEGDTAPKNDYPIQTPSKSLLSSQALKEVATNTKIRELQERLEKREGNQVSDNLKPQNKNLIPASAVHPYKNTFQKSPYYEKCRAKIIPEMIDFTKQKSLDDLRKIVCGSNTYGHPTNTEIYQQLKQITTNGKSVTTNKREKEKIANSWMLIASLFNIENLTSQFKGKDIFTSLSRWITKYKHELRHPEDWRISALIQLNEEKLTANSNNSTLLDFQFRIEEECKLEYSQWLKSHKQSTYLEPRVDLEFEKYESERLARKAAKQLQTT